MKKFWSTAKAGKAKGFTLIEVVVSTGILSMSMAGSLGLTLWVARGTAYGHHLNEATTAIQSRAEQLIEVGYEDLAPGSETIGIWDIDWTVEPCSYGKKLTFHVQWKNVSGRTRHFTTTGLLTEDMTVATLPAFALPGAESGGEE